MKRLDRRSMKSRLLTIPVGIFIVLAWSFTACAPQESTAPTPEAADPVAEAPTVDTDPADGWIDGPAGRLRVEVTGVGEPTLVFVHGNGSNRTVWAAQVEHFSRWYRVVTLDLRGFGESEVPEFAEGKAPMKVEAVVEDLETLVEVLDLPPFVLVGHSWGGAVVSAYAGRNPDRLAALVFADVAGTWAPTAEMQAQLLERLSGDQYPSFVESWFMDILKPYENSTYNAVMDSLEATPREVFVGAVKGMWGYEVEAAQAPYTGPRCAIAAEFLENQDSIHLRIAIDHKVTLPEVSHWLMMDDPQGFNEALEDCLGLVEGADTKADAG